MTEKYWGALHQSANPLTWGRTNGEQSGGIPCEPWEIPWNMREGKDSPGRLSFCCTEEELAHAELCKVSPSCQVWCCRVFQSTVDGTSDIIYNLISDVC